MTFLLEGNCRGWIRWGGREPAESARQPWDVLWDLGMRWAAAVSPGSGLGLRPWSLPR